MMTTTMTMTAAAMKTTRVNKYISSCCAFRFEFLVYFRMCLDLFLYMMFGFSYLLASK